MRRIRIKSYSICVDIYLFSAFYYVLLIDRYICFSYSFRLALHTQAVSANQYIDVA